MKAKWLIGLMMLFFAGWMAGTARADFTLYGNEQLKVDTSRGQGWIYGLSTVWVVFGGQVSSIDAYHSSTVDISGGNVMNYICAYDSSTANVSGGEVWGSLCAYDTSTVNISGGVVSFYAYDTSTVKISGGTVAEISTNNSSTVDISGGSVNYLQAGKGSTVDISGGSVDILETHDGSTVDISGGSVNHLDAYKGSTVAIHGHDFFFGTGLSLDGDRILGTGILSAQWFDGTGWATTISGNTGATISIPDPATLSLLALGALAVMRRRRR